MEMKTIYDEGNTAKSYDQKVLLDMALFTAERYNIPRSEVERLFALSPEALDTELATLESKCATINEERRKLIFSEW